MAGYCNDNENRHLDTSFVNDETWPPNHSMQILQINARNSMIRFKQSLIFYHSVFDLSSTMKPMKPVFHSLKEG